LHSKRLALARHRAGLLVVSAKKYGFRILRLDRSQQRREIHGLVVRVLTLDDLSARGSHRSLELVRKSLSIGGRIVDDGKAFELQVLYRVLAQCFSLLAVVGHQSKGCLVPLHRVLDVGRHRELRNASVKYTMQGYKTAF